MDCWWWWWLVSGVFVVLPMSSIVVASTILCSSSSAPMLPSQPSLCALSPPLLPCSQRMYLFILLSLLGATWTVAIPFRTIVARTTRLQLDSCSHLLAGTSLAHAYKGRKPMSVSRVHVVRLERMMLQIASGFPGKELFGFIKG